MADTLEAELDRLFQCAPDAMVEARNALAARLRKAGARAQADQVKALKRPTPAAWALNQLHFDQPALLERARACALEVRRLHARDGVDARALAAAVAAQRSAMHELMAAALERCEASAIAAGPQQQRKLLATIHGWLSGAGQEPPGRLTHDIEHGGFDVITAVGTAPVRQPSAPVPAGAAVERRPASGAPPGSPARVAERTPPAAVGAAREARARAEALARHERELRAAGDQVRQRRADQQRAARELERAQAAQREAEARLTELRAACRAREAELAQAQAGLDAALSAQADVEQALATARAGTSGA